MHQAHLQVFSSLVDFSRYDVYVRIGGTYAKQRGRDGNIIQIGLNLHRGFLGLGGSVNRHQSQSQHTGEKEGSQASPLPNPFCHGYIAGRGPTRPSREQTGRMIVAKITCTKGSASGTILDQISGITFLLTVLTALEKLSEGIPLFSTSKCTQVKRTASLQPPDRATRNLERKSLPLCVDGGGGESTFRPTFGKVQGPQRI